MFCLKRTTVLFCDEAKNVFHLHLNGHTYCSKEIKELLDQKCILLFFLPNCGL